MTQHPTQDDRPDPDALLAGLRREDEQRRRGTLKIFLGMAPGVGKTYAMLEAARRARAAGREVVVGVVETHGRAETEALAQGLPVVPRRPVVYRGVTLSELDLDALLARRPVVALVDELAHTNAPGMRHPKRHQDVQELLEAGIDVFSTLNVQHVASRADTVREVTGVTVHETVPDAVLDGAEIEVVDLPPEELIRRLDEGKVYLPERAEAALRNFFHLGNLTALREIALRVAAAQVGQDLRDYMSARQIAGPWKTGHRLLVAVSASPHSEQMVRWTRRLADSLGCPWIAAHVETSRPLPEAAQARLTRHLTLAKELGAEVRTTSDDDVARGLLRIARAQNVTQIAAGKPESAWPFCLGATPPLLRRLLRESGDIDLHLVRVTTDGHTPRRPALRWPAESALPQYGLAAAGVALVTLLCLALYRLVGPQSVALVYLVGVVGMAMRLGRGPVYLAATLSALLWDFLFLPPRFTLRIQNVSDLMMFATYFVVAIAMGQLIARIRAKDRMDRRREARASAVYLLTLELGDASGLDAIARVVVEHVERTFRARAALLLPDADGRLRGPGDDKELAAAQWACDKGTPAGRFTETLPMVGAMYQPLRVGDRSLGVLRLEWPGDAPPTLEQRGLLDQFLRHIALVLDRQRLRDAEAEARVVAESERLGRALLNSVSHELRTPIAALQSAAAGLAEDAPPALHRTLAAEVLEASHRLNRLVGNLLDIARLESGRLKPRLDWCEVNDVVQGALARARDRLGSRPMEVLVPNGLPLVRMDSVLTEQALANLLFNAALHTPAGSPVRVTATLAEHALELAVADRGPGIPAETQARIFDKFFRAPGAPAGGIGLGLSIVKGFAEAQGGRVSVGNRPGGGAVFTLTLPRESPPACDARGEEGP